LVLLFFKPRGEDHWRTSLKLQPYLRGCSAQKRHVQIDQPESRLDIKNNI
jgi:hypothetical protein